MKNKFAFIVFLLLVQFNEIQAQHILGKPVIDSSSYQAWYSLMDYKLSDNGNFVSYSKVFQNGIAQVSLKSSTGQLLKEIILPIGSHPSSMFFSNKSKFFIAQVSDSSAIIYNLEKKADQRIVKGRDFQFGKQQSKLVGRSSYSDSIVVIYSLDGKNQITFKEVCYSKLSESGKLVLVVGQGKSKRLIYYNLSHGIPEDIYRGEIDANSLEFDNSFSKVAFKTSTEGLKKIIVAEFANFQTFDLGVNDEKSKDSIENITYEFSPFGTKLFLYSRESHNYQFNEAVNVWSYRDAVLQSVQLENLKQGNERRLKFIYDFSSGKFSKINLKGFETRENSAQDLYIMLDKDPKVLWFDKDAPNNKEYFLNLSTQLIDSLDINLINHEFSACSPDRQLRLYYDYEHQTLMSVDVLNRQTTKLNLGDAILHDEDALEVGRKGLWGIAGWIANGFVYMYDQFDIWKIDLSGKTQAKCLTEGYGRKNNIKLTLISLNPNHENEFINLNDYQILSGFDNKAKNGGYWKVKLDNFVPLDKGHLMNYSVLARPRPTGNNIYASGNIIKATDAEKFIVIRENASESPNIYSTSDFKSYTKISDVNPEQNYNWIKAELVEWKMLNGEVSQGILYKPKNFDPSIKYPIIFNYYEKRTEGFHKYLKPEYSYHEINIPTFVSAGYLVFVPDIYYTPKYNGKGAFNALESAAIALSKLPFVDSTRIGLQGFSFGGWQTNYMIAHSKRFAAACEGAGVSNQVSGYNQLSLNGTDRQQFYELNSQGTPYGFGVTPWREPEAYIRNSPVFRLHEVSTPLLMMHGDKDAGVPYEQALEMYLGLRREGKKVWFIQYENAGHGFVGFAKDCHTRMMQFFNYYLKGTQPPFWMTTTIPATNRDDLKNFELDTSGTKP